MGTPPAEFVAALLAIETGNDTARWNFDAAVGTFRNAPGGIGTAAAVTFSFPTALPFYASPADHPDFAPFSATQQDGARLAFAAWSEVADITFTEVPLLAGPDLRNISLGLQALPNAGGAALYPAYFYQYRASGRIVAASPTLDAGDVWLSDYAVNDDVSPGSYGYQTLLHEIGHAIGLKHPFENGPILPTATDDYRYTIMSYTEPTNFGIVTVFPEAIGYRWQVASFEPTTPMLYDIAAAQYLYGARTETRAGDDRYAWAPNARLFETIWGGGGVDTIDTSNQTLPSVIDLNAGAFSSIAQRLTDAAKRLEIPAYATQAPTPTYDGIGNLAIAFGVTIENAIDGAGSDRLLGNAAANRLFGGGGNDTLNGGGGADTLDGGAGFDVVPLTLGKRNVASGVGPDGSWLQVPGDAADLLHDIEAVSLADGRLVFDPADPAAQVVRLYNVALGRAPDQDGLNAWLGALLAGVPLQALGNAFIGSDEFAARYGGNVDDGRFVTLLYQNALLREPDAGGLAAWTGALGGGLSRATVVLGFSESAENQANTDDIVAAGIWDRSENAAAAARMYDTAFGRLPDLPGLVAWRGALDSGLSLSGMANGFVGSAEFAARFGNPDNAAFATLLYENALRRGPDAAGLAGWIAALDAGASRAQIVVGFSESAEHIGLTAADVLGRDPGDYGILFA